MGVHDGMGGLAVHVPSVCEDSGREVRHLCSSFAPKNYALKILHVARPVFEENAGRHPVNFQHISKITLDYVLV